MARVPLFPLLCLAKEGSVVREKDECKAKKPSSEFPQVGVDLWRLCLAQFYAALLVGFSSVSEILAMGFGILTFIFFFSALENSLWLKNRTRDPLLYKAKTFAIGAKMVTAGIALAGILGAVFIWEGFLLLAFGELFPGQWALFVVESWWIMLFEMSPSRIPSQKLPWSIVEPHGYRMLFVYITTLVQGAFLTFVMAVFGLLAGAFLALWDKRKVYPFEDER